MLAQTAKQRRDELMVNYTYCLMFATGCEEKILQGKKVAVCHKTVEVQNSRNKYLERLWPTLEGCISNVIKTFYYRAD